MALSLMLAKMFDFKGNIIQALKIDTFCLTSKTAQYYLSTYLFFVIYFEGIHYLCLYNFVIVLYPVKDFDENT